jgi:hypothetical protein
MWRSNSPPSSWWWSNEPVLTFRTPETLVAATIDLQAERIHAATDEHRIGARGDFALRRTSGPDGNGHGRFMCPTHGARPKVRCKLRHTSLADR